MKKKLLTIVLTAAMLVSVLTPVSALAGDTISVGTWDALVDAVLEDDGYSGDTIRLTADITAAPGDSWPGFTDFAGTFDGAGHTIYGIRMNGTSETDPMGFFNSTVSGAVIRDLVLSDGSFRNKSLVAPLVGKVLGNLTVQNVRVSADTAVSGSYQFGGLIGRVEGNAAITNCWSAATVTSANVGGRAAAGSVGGLIGWVHAGSQTVITGCSYTGTLTTTTSNNYGGIVGSVYATDSSQTLVRIASSATAFSFAGSGGRRGGLVGGSMGGAEYITIELVNDYTNNEVVVGDNISGAISGTDLSYWTPKTTGGTVNTTVKTIAYPSQLMGYALASKSYNFNGRTLSLTDDIDMSGYGEWPMFGSTGKYFIGSINGNGHTLSGLYVNTVSETLSPAVPTGFVSILYLTASVSDLTISDSSFSNNTAFTGAVAGRVLEGAAISGVHVTSDVTVSGYDQVGGIAGTIKGTVQTCWSEADVILTGESTDLRTAGGIVGTVLVPTSNSIADCLFTGSVTATDSIVGGILGATRNSNTNVSITGCVSAGTLNGLAAGGILGDFSRIYRQEWIGNTYTQTYTISNCYAAPASRAVGSLSAGFADSFVTNTSVYAGISSLYGNACSLLSSSVWTKRSGNIPMLTIFNDSGLSVVSTGTFTEIDAASCRSIREALGGVPLPDTTDCQEITEARSGLYYYNRTCRYGTGAVKSKYLEYVSTLQSAGFVLVNGGTASLTSVNSSNMYTALFTKSGYYLLVRFNDGDSSKSIYACIAPVSGTQVTDGEELFDGVPTLSWSADAVDCGQNCFMKTFTSKTSSDYESLCAALVSGGFTLASSNGSGLYGKILTRSYQKGDKIVTAVFSTKRGEILLSVSEDTELSPHLNNQATWAADNTAFDSTMMVMPRLTQGKGNSFVFRLKNGHFLINDGGEIVDGENLVTMLENLSPAGQIPVVDAWFISHGHEDHLGSLVKAMRDPALRSRIRVNGVYYSDPSTYIWTADTEGCYGLSREFLKGISLLRTSSGSATPLYRNFIGERYYFSDISVDIVFSQEYLPFTENSASINDTSTWISVNIDGDTVLLGGDGSEGEMDRLQSVYDSTDMSFTMRSLLHHGYNERTYFLSFCSADTILYTCLSDGEGLSYGKSAAAIAAIEASSAETIDYDEDRWFTFPYSTGTSETPEDISEYRSGSGFTAPEAPEGKVFGGWYWDAAFTLPVESGAATGNAFARFVDEDVLQVRYVQDGTEYPEATKKLWIATTVDTLGYQRAGFTVSFVNSSGTSVTREFGTTTVFESLNWFVDGSDDPYAPTVFSSESEYFVSYKLAASRFVVANNPGGITVTPFWITKDGTRVTGTALTGVTFGTGTGLQEITGDGDEIMLD
ncbi:MAG: hypothetical protein IKR26_00260 [Lachnospiraceae bacterium]|nr:hypothetical protein [Lachnospiraceae bacterium]